MTDERSDPFGDTPQVLKSVEIAHERNAQIGSELRSFRSYVPGFDFDPRGTSCISLVEAAVSFPKRASHLFDACEDLWSSTHYLPSVVLARAYLETVAMGVHYLVKLESRVGRGDLAAVEALLQRIYRGARHPMISPEVESVHVLDAIRSIDRVESRWLDGSLDGKFRPVIESVVEPVDHKGTCSLGLMDCYEHLSEYAHPNALGAHSLFPLFDEDEAASELRVTALTHARAARLRALNAGRHLLSGLNGLEQTVTDFFQLVRPEREPN